ncbi:MAG TPA: hypothetical protein VIM41_09170 [Gammaproteobacteria bacterium]
MLRKLIYSLILLAIAATIAYQMGWLSYKGEKTYEKTKEAIVG